MIIKVCNFFLHFAFTRFYELNTTVIIRKICEKAENIFKYLIIEAKRIFLL